jgi:hypothetical protein
MQFQNLERTRQKRGGNWWNFKLLIIIICRIINYNFCDYSDVSRPWPRKVDLSVYCDKYKIQQKRGVIATDIDEIQKNWINIKYRIVNCSCVDYYDVSRPWPWKVGISVYVGNFEIQQKRGEIASEIDKVQNIELTSSVES